MGPASPQLSELLETSALERASALVGRTLPVPEPLEGLLPWGGLRRGTVVGLTGAGATSLALVLVAEATREGWAAIAGMPWLGVAAAAELGVALDRLVMVGDRRPEDDGRSTRALASVGAAPSGMTEVLAALVDAFDVVVTTGLGPRHARRLAARARERDAVLLVLGPRQVEADLGLHVDSCAWHGIGRGHGHLAARSLTVSTHGRGAAARPRRTTLQLPLENLASNSTVERGAALTMHKAPQFRNAPLDPEPGSSTVQGRRTQVE